MSAAVDRAVALGAQQVLEQDLQRERQPRDVEARLQRVEAEDLEPPAPSASSARASKLLADMTAPRVGLVGAPDYRAAASPPPLARVGCAPAWDRDCTERRRSLSLPEALGILAAGGAAGAINVVVGSGTLITFPVLLAFGYAPVVANVSNTIGLVPGSVAGRGRLPAASCAARAGASRRLACATAAGAATGATLLLTLPPSAFKAIVPAFIVARAGPDRRAAAADARCCAAAGAHAARAPRRRRRCSAVYATGVYGGYFGAAQGIMLLAILGLALDDTLQRINADEERARRPGQPALGRDLRRRRPRRLARGRR